MKQVERPSQAAPGTVTLDTAEGRLKRLRRSTITTARLVSQYASGTGYRHRAALVTLTYRPEVEWQPGHVSGFLRHVRQWATRRGAVVANVWVSELTKAGRVHYHVMLWLPRGVTIPKPDKQGWWPHGMTRIEWARNAVGYLAKYASKGTLETGYAFPKGCRLYGAGGMERLVRICRAWWMLPTYVRDICNPAHRVGRSPGGGFVARATGEWIAPAYAKVGLSRGTVTLSKLAWSPPTLGEVPFTDQFSMTCGAPQ